MYSYAPLQHTFRVFYTIKLLDLILSVELEPCKPQEQYKYQHQQWKEDRSFPIGIFKMSSKTLYP